MLSDNNTIFVSSSLVAINLAEYKHLLYLLTHQLTQKLHYLFDNHLPLGNLLELILLSSNLLHHQ